MQLVAADPLAVDNTRYFTVEVRPPARVLLLAERPQDARFVREALSPTLGEASSRFECEVRTFDDGRPTPPLDDFQAVLLLDPAPLADELWTACGSTPPAAAAWASSWATTPTSKRRFNAEAPQRLLPGKLKRISREETYLRPRRLDHPALAGLRDYAEDIPWPVCKVFRFWQFEDDGRRRLRGRRVRQRRAGDHRTARRPRPRARRRRRRSPIRWSPRAANRGTCCRREPWPFVALCDQLVGYLAQDADERLDYLAGETARVRLAPQQQVASYVLRLPDGQAASRVAAGDDELAVSVTDALGNYRLTAGGAPQRARPRLQRERRAAKSAS